MPVQRKHDFISVDCKRLLATLEDFTTNLKEFVEYAADLEAEKIKLKEIVERLDALVSLAPPDRMAAMWQLIKDRQTARQRRNV